MKTISELITELEATKGKYGDLPVLVCGYEEDYDAVTDSRVVRVADKGADEKKRCWWSGRYEEFQTADPALSRFDAVVIEW